MLSILGISVTGIAAYFVFKTAKDTQRSPIGWTLATFAVGIGLQIVLPVIAVILIGVAMLASGRSEAETQKMLEAWAFAFTVICLILSFIGIALILRHVSKLPEEESFVSPPEPPNFS